MKEYNGFRSWNAWNISLWLNNDESNYQAMVNSVKCSYSIRRAARNLLTYYSYTRTPDGGVYNISSTMGAMEGLEHLLMKSKYKTLGYGV